MRRLKILGIVMVAVLAVSAVAATTASALYHSEVKATNISGIQKAEAVISTDVGNLTCTTATRTAKEVIGTEKTANDFFTEMLTFDLAFGKATGSGKCSLGGVTVEVSASSNKETSTSSTSTTEEHWYHSNSHVESTTGSSIVAKDTAGLKCEVAIPPQIPGGVTRYRDFGFGPTREVEAVSELTAIAYNWTAGCPNAKGKAGSNTNGTYSGSSLIKGSNAVGGAQVGIWVE